MLLAPPTTDPARVAEALRGPGYAVLDAAATCRVFGCEPAGLQALAGSWDRLAPDEYLKDGGRYRRRRHASYIGDGDAIQGVPHRAHWQPVEYNALHGGMQRWFEPVEADVARSREWRQLLAGTARLASRLKGEQRWFIEAHQFRIDTEGGIGRPTPEGAHRDGVDLVAVFLVGRHAIKGGETRVFEAAGPAGQRFTLVEPWSVLLLDDERVIHESTPIQPAGDGPGWRDTLVLTCRARGFQEAWGAR